MADGSSLVYNLVIQNDTLLEVVEIVREPRLFQRGLRQDVGRSFVESLVLFACQSKEYFLDALIR